MNDKAEEESIDLHRDETTPTLNFDLLKQFWEEHIAVDNRVLDEKHNFDNDDSVTVAADKMGNYETAMFGLPHNGSRIDPRF